MSVRKIHKFFSGLKNIKYFVSQEDRKSNHRPNVNINIRSPNIRPCYRFHFNYPKISPRLYSATTEQKKITAETKLQDILKKKFPSAKSVEVVDVSGGCGAMYEISVAAPEFKGLSIVKQHMLINEALKHEIKEMHGLRIHTEVSQ